MRDVKLRPFSSEETSDEQPLITVTCMDHRRQVIGEGHVDIAVPDGDNEREYLLRITGMLNIAFAASNMPALSRENIDRYRPIISFIQDQYRDILGKELDLPASPGLIEEFIKNIVLDLPDAYKLPAKMRDDHYRRERTILIAA